jgi:hypothetical protein
MWQQSSNPPRMIEGDLLVPAQGRLYNRNRKLFCHERGAAHRKNVDTPSLAGWC